VRSDTHGRERTMGRGFEQRRSVAREVRRRSGCRGVDAVTTRGRPAPLWRGGCGRMAATWKRHADRRAWRGKQLLTDGSLVSAIFRNKNYP
jgi:hypothetical protein